MKNKEDNLIPDKGDTEMASEIIMADIYIPESYDSGNSNQFDEDLFPEDYYEVLGAEFDDPEEEDHEKDIVIRIDLEENPVVRYMTDEELHLLHDAWIDDEPFEDLYEDLDNLISNDHDIDFHHDGNPFEDFGNVELGMH